MSTRVATELGHERARRNADTGQSVECALFAPLLLWDGSSYGVTLPEPPPFVSKPTNSWFGYAICEADTCNECEKAKGGQDSDDLRYTRNRCSRTISCFL